MIRPPRRFVPAALLLAAAPISWISFSAEVAVSQSFPVTVLLPDLYCGEIGHMVPRIRADSALLVEVDWRGITRRDVDCDDPGGAPFFTSFVISGIPGPTGRSLPVRSGEHTFGRIAVVAATQGGHFDDLATPLCGDSVVFRIETP